MCVLMATSWSVESASVLSPASRLRLLWQPLHKAALQAPKRFFVLPSSLAYGVMICCTVATLYELELRIRGRSIRMSLTQSCAASACCNCPSTCADITVKLMPFYSAYAAVRDKLSQFSTHSFVLSFSLDAIQQCTHTHTHTPSEPCRWTVFVTRQVRLLCTDLSKNSLGVGQPSRCL